MNSHTLLVGLNNQFHHLVMVVEALVAVIARLIGIILILPARMRFCHAVQERLDADNMEIFTAVLGTIRCDAGHLCLRIFGIVRTHQVGIGAQLKLALLFQLIESPGSDGIGDLYAGIGHCGVAVCKGHILPGEQIVLGILKGSGKLGIQLEYRGLADVTVRFAVFVYVHQFIAHSLCVGCVNARPLQRLGIEQHGMSATSLHDK